MPWVINEFVCLLLDRESVKTKGAIVGELSWWSGFSFTFRVWTAFSWHGGLGCGDIRSQGIDK